MATTQTPTESPSLQEQFAQFEGLREQYTKAAQKRLADIEQEAADLRASLKAAGASVSNGSSASSPAPRRRSSGRRSGSGKRAEQFVEAVRENPGITVSEISKKIDVKPNYLYRVAKLVQEKGEVVRDGRGYKVPA